MSQGVISDFNDANPEKLGSVADYYFLKKSEGKSMSQIKQSFAYDHDLNRNHIRTIKVPLGAHCTSRTHECVISSGTNARRVFFSRTHEYVI